MAKLNLLIMWLKLVKFLEGSFFEFSKFFDTICLLKIVVGSDQTKEVHR